MDRKLDNFIEGLLRDFPLYSSSEYEKFYIGFSDDRVKLLFSTFHTHLVAFWKKMNTKLPNLNEEKHFPAELSRSLLTTIHSIYNLQKAFTKTEFAFEIDSEYNEVMNKCLTFLKRSGGSTIPTNSEPITLPYTIRLFTPLSSLKIEHPIHNEYPELKHIGEGSYAHVYSYHDSFYNHDFILKRAKKNLSDKEYKRFKQEFDIMQELKSPYIVKVGLMVKNVAG